MDQFTQDTIIDSLSPETDPWIRLRKRQAIKDKEAEIKEQEKLRRRRMRRGVKRGPYKGARLSYIVQQADLDPETREVTEYRLNILAWVKANKGVLSKIAEETGRSLSYVSYFVHGKRSGGKNREKMEEVLRKYGCPFQFGRKL